LISDILSPWRPSGSLHDESYRSVTAAAIVTTTTIISTILVAVLIAVRKY
jgi:hypothetical protein